MKKIVPFKKDIIFKTDIEEVTSISLEHSLEKKQEYTIGGNFIVSGEYRITESSTSKESFSYELPFEINLDEKYELKDATIDIDDFYYEIINNKVLSVSIDVAIDKLEEKELPKEEIMEEKEELVEPVREENIDSEETERCIDLEDVNVQTNEQEIYKSYKVYIVREGDTIESILEKYGVTKTDLESYNDLSTLNINDKILIPSIDETNS